MREDITAKCNNCIHKGEMTEVELYCAEAFMGSGERFNWCKEHNEGLEEMRACYNFDFDSCDDFKPTGKESGDLNESIVNLSKLINRTTK